MPVEVVAVGTDLFTYMDEEHRASLTANWNYIFQAGNSNDAELLNERKAESPVHEKYD